MVPILDLQVWVHHPSDQELEEGLESDTVMWMYYEKATASKHVLRASSAFTWRCKLTTMSMEVFRYMRKTSRQVTLVSRSRVLNGLVEKLRLSGYSQGTVRGIIESGLKFYYQKLRVDL